MCTAVHTFAASPSHTTFPGALDTSFDSDGLQTLSVSAGVDYIHDMQVLDDGKILAVGAVNNHYGLMRFNADLTLDATFGTEGVTETDLGNGRHAYTLEIDRDGRILVGGAQYVARYSADGVLDSTFGTNGSIENPHVSQIYDLAIQPDGKLLAMGGPDNSTFRITRYLEDGTVDEPFGNRAYDAGSGTRGDERDYGRAVAVKDEGDILLIGTGQWLGSSGQGLFSRYSLYRIDTNSGDRAADRRGPSR